MAPKHSLDPPNGSSAPERKKTRKGFSVGPANLPDGSYKRKVDKIRRNLVENAKIKKSYDKLKARERAAASSTHAAASSTHAASQNSVDCEGDQDTTALEPVSPEPHPERQALMQSTPSEQTLPSLTVNDDNNEGPASSDVRRRQKRKSAPFVRERYEGEKQKAEVNKRREERAAANAERERKLAERERWRRAMSKAKGRGPHGQRKLGRESKILLEKVKRMVDGD